MPENLWDFTIGGYQVMKKWLSYREQSLLGRALTPDEAREVTHMARRLAALPSPRPRPRRQLRRRQSARDSPPTNLTLTKQTKQVNGR